MYISISCNVYFYEKWKFINHFGQLWLQTRTKQVSAIKKKNCYAWAPYLFIYFLYSIYLSWFNSLFVSWFYFQSRLNFTVRLSKIIKLNYIIKFLTFASLRQESYKISRCCRFMLINLAVIRLIIWNVVLKQSGCNKQTS